MVYVSFIIPFYGVENFIKQCLESIYSQPISEGEYEVICIDDCSPDLSREIVKQYQKKHENLSLIVNHENLRLGGGRNVGINHAKGKYLWFVDSDDMIAENILPQFIELCRTYTPDVLAFNFVRVDQQHKIVYSGNTHPNLQHCKNGLLYIKETFGIDYQYYIMGYVWSYLYRTDFIKGCALYFPEKVLWEDTIFAPKALFEADKVMATDKVGYCYRVNPNSITGVYRSQYPAEYIYQYAFIAGKDVLEFAPTIPDLELRNVCMLLVNKYFNSFVLDLFRTSHTERKKFFNLYSINRKELSYIRPYLKPLSKCMLSNCKQWNLLIADLGATFYKLTHKRK